MAQQEIKILPKYINTDISTDKLMPDEALWMKGIEWSMNGNPDTGIGLNNSFNEAQNILSLTPTRSNLSALQRAGIESLLPSGYNKNIGTFESVLTQELYYFNYNINQNYGIYVISGNTGSVKKVVVDKELAFTDNPENFIAEHRVALRIVYDKDKNIVEKILTITEGSGWQKWINVMTAINTDGFNSSVYPYFTLTQPHFDRRELLEWAVRPPMYNPIVTPIPNTPDETGIVNQLIDQSFQFSCRFGNTDGRMSVFSPYSLPLIIKSEDYLNNPNNLPKSSEIILPAGSPLTEYIDVFVRKSSKKQQGVPSTQTWGDWYWVERVYKFGSNPNVLGTEYWKRENPWANNEFDAEFNTIKYVFDNKRLADIVDQNDALRLQNDIPQISVAQGILNDTAALANNRVDYDNAPSELVDKISAEVAYKENNACEIPLRKITLYVYAGRERGNRSIESKPRTRNIWHSQFGYNADGDDQMRFGGVYLNADGVQFDIDESKFFDLTFKDKDGFRVYLKGTPYYADCKWYVVKDDSQFTLVPVDSTINKDNSSNATFVKQTYEQKGFFVGVAELFVPAGRYIAAIGRHNVGNSQNYRGTSTYVMGIANSRQAQLSTYEDGNKDITVRTLKPSALVSTSKEMEIDCTSADVDVWGNNADTFYVCTPFMGMGESTGGANRNRWSFLEGYLFESKDNGIPIELFPYSLSSDTIGYNGQITDKNGFFFGYTWGGEADVHTEANIEVAAKVNCAYPFNFTIQNNANGDPGWKANHVAYLSDFNSGEVGASNRVYLYGRVTSLDGTIGYSNIGVSIKDGQTDYTDIEGRFRLSIHNGINANRVSNVYVNAGGNFRITIAGCGSIPLFNYDETQVACSISPSSINPCTGEVVTEARVYPYCYNLAVKAEGGSETSLKENSSLSIGFACADLAGRLMYVNVVDNISVPSYMETGQVLASYLKLIFSSALEFNKFNPDMKWFAPYVSPQLNVLKYFQWVGDKVNYINSNGEVVDDAGSAVFASVVIDSLYNYNLNNNFSLLANWQFTPEDRVRILDNGDGQLFDVATYGEPIDLQVLGTNYNDAAKNAGIIQNDSPTPIVNNYINTTTETIENNRSITFYVRYDSRLDEIKGKTGFWIELYTPSQQTDKIPYNELKWYPIINGEVSEFTGIQNGLPSYNKPTELVLDYWDTYLYSRNISIPEVGSKFFNHPFCSPNVSDSFGAYLNSGGRQWVRNDNAKQIWKINNVIKSDVFITTGVVNGLGTFRNDKAHVTDYENNHFDGIMAMLTNARSVVLFVCKNDFFTTNYDFHFTYPNEQGVMVANLDNGLSRPFQKIGDAFGMSADSQSSMLVHDKYVWWHDAKNEAYVMCDYKSATNIADIVDKEGRKYGIDSYMEEKTQFVSKWNSLNKVNSRFDVITGIDIKTSKLFITFRPRRINSNELSSYVDERRGISLDSQETICYDYEAGRWVGAAKFTPESYGKIRGLSSGVELVSFAAGNPYYHVNTGNESFLNYYGIQTEPSITIPLNDKPEIVKILQSLSLSILPNKMYVDLVYDNDKDSYSYLPTNFIEKKENVYYGGFLRDMSSYLPESEQAGSSTLQDGKRIFGRYFVIRLVGDPTKLNEYFQLSDIFYSYTNSESNKK